MIPSDRNGEGTLRTLSIFAVAYGSTLSDPNWNHGIADLNEKA